jgi:group I intron endonuclease
MAYIYVVTNKVNGKQYVGQTKQHEYKKRWWKHMNDCSGAALLLEAIKEYGLKNFTFTILIICFEEDRWIYEVEYIMKYGTVRIPFKEL